MAQVEATADGRIVVWSEWSEKELVKAIPGARWDNDAKVWLLPLSWASCQTLRGMFRDRLVIGPALTEWAHREVRERIEPCMALRGALTLDEVPDGMVDERVRKTILSWRGRLARPLYAFQEVGVAFQATALQDLLGDEMGTGKTVQTILATRLRQEISGDAFPVCVVCPNSLKPNWSAEWAMWDGPLGSAEVVVVGGGKRKKEEQLARVAELAGAGEEVVAVVNIEAMRLHSRLAPYGNIALKPEQGRDRELNAIPFRTVIVDEAHRMKDPKSQQARAIWSIQHGDGVRHRFSLTGTPIANHPGDLWPTMHGVAPEDFPRKTSYVDRFCLQSWNPFGGLDIVGLRPDTADEFRRFFEPRFRRMPKELVLPFLPPKVRTLRRVGMHPKQARAYREMRDQMATRTEDGDLVLATNSLAVNTRLVQFASAYAHLDEAGEVRLEDVHGTAASGPTKLDAMMDVVAEMDGAQLVIAAESRQLIELAGARLVRAGVGHTYVVGGMSDLERSASIERFQGGQAQAMLMTLKAGGVGLTLTAAGTMLFLQRSWSMVDNVQAEDRVHRIGSEQHDKIVVVDLVTEGTIEEEQIPRLQAKLARLQEIARDAELLRQHGRVAELAALEAEQAALAAGQV